MADSSVAQIRQPRRRSSVRSGTLRLELTIVLSEEFGDLIRHREELGPLFLVQRDGKTAEPINGEPALLADLEIHGSAGLILELGVFAAQPLELGLEIFV